MARKSTPKSNSLQFVTGDERAFLEQMIEVFEQRSEVQRKEGKLVEAAEIMQTTRFLRRLCPPASRIHNRGWNNGDLIPIAYVPVPIRRQHEAT
jgi:hypothetical protein